MNYYLNSYSETNKKEFKRIYSLAENALFNKLANIPFEKSGVSEYNQRYIGEHIHDRKKISWFLSHIFMLVYQKNGFSFNNLTIIDYGGGSGVLSFMAKELGISKVIYNDIYEVSCHDVELMSQLLDIKIDDIISGDILEVTRFVQAHNYSPNFILAHDVIEHIYDVRKWFDQASTMQADKLHIICTSHANKYNWLINNKLRTLQKRAEKYTREKEWGSKERDSLDSYLNLRKNIIQNFEPALSPDEVSLLANKTRGQIKADIETTVSRFIETREINYHINHPTNTCDPLTGNWVEQLIDVYALKKYLESQNCAIKISYGFYINEKGSALVKKLKLFTNSLIKKSGSWARFVSPYYIFETTVRN